MGAGQSVGLEINGSSLGYQVLRVYPNSPGSQAGLKAYFDFIVAIGDTRFCKEDGALREILKASIDQKLKMVVFNTRSKTAREVEIVPTTSWGGSGLLGVSIKHSSFDRADERVWHVVEVDPGSPAHQAGFKAGEDYVIGSDSVLQENDDLYNLIETHEGKALKLFVYNSKTDNCREVICHPNSKWGGRGYLGCEFGHGLLHRIPYGDNQDAGSTAIRTTNMGNKGFPPTQPPNQQLARQQQQQLPLNGLPVHNQGAPRFPTQPGNQMFQQALFNNATAQSPHQIQKPSIDQSPKVQPPPPPPSQVPQTFAQLADAQYHQDMQQRQQQQQHQQMQQHHHNQQQQQQQQQKQQQQQAAPPPASFVQSPLTQSQPTLQQQNQPMQQPPFHTSFVPPSHISPNMAYQSQLPPPAPAQSPPQPGNQMSQQALFDSTPAVHYAYPPPPAPPPVQAPSAQQQLEQQRSNQAEPVYPPPQVPQTFAQLASHSLQHQDGPPQQPKHNQPPQQQSASFYPPPDVNFH